MTVLTTPIFEYGQPEHTRDTAYFHVIGNGGDRFCVSNAHCIERYFEGLTDIYRDLFLVLLFIYYIKHDSFFSSLELFTQSL
jgi:hypothetical protein